MLQIPEFVSRSEMMMLLMDVEYILLRASYDPLQTRSSLKDISVEMADGSVSTGTPANLVERCDCPAGYTGETDSPKTFSSVAKTCFLILLASQL